MVIFTQTCAVHHGTTGVTIYLKKRVASAVMECFPPSKDANFDYRAEFNDETGVLTISKDE